MRAEDWRVLKAHLSEVLDAPREERAGRLAEARREAPRLAHDLVAWLELEPEALAALPLSGEDLEAGRPARSACVASPGDRIGDHRVVRVLGFGGDAIVYEAEQDEPHRRVALKVLRGGLDAPIALRRFLDEADLLARLNHPAIATIHAAGTHVDADGVRPWFSLELVEGAASLLDYARDRGLATYDRVALFLEACDAVDHGHRRGVVHRDLKPQNVLVDRTGQVKVIDFGVAKLIGATPTEGLVTQAGDLVGTLAYMSPEQCAGDPAAVGLPSDVYALGSLLYELLCDAPVLPAEEASIARTLERIRDREPLPPSRHAPGLDLDLEAILLTALAKDPDRRYGSAGALAADLRRHLAGEPVSARPPSLLHLARLRLHRHRRLAAAVLAVGLLCVAGTFTAWRANRRVETVERARAERVTDFLASLLALSAPSRARGEELTVRELLDHAAERLETELADAPSARREIHMTIGGAYRELGLFALAEEQFRAGLDLARSEGTSPAGLAAHLHTRAQVLVELGRAAEAEALLREALAIEAREPSVPAVYAGITANRLGEALAAQGRLAEAAEAADRAVATYERILGSDHPAVAAALWTAAEVAVRDGRRQGALELGRRAFSITESRSAAGSLEVALASARLATLLAGDAPTAGEEREAGTLLDAALPILEQCLPAEHRTRIEARSLHLALSARG